MFTYFMLGWLGVLIIDVRNGTGQVASIADVILWMLSAVSLKALQTIGQQGHAECGMPNSIVVYCIAQSM